MSEERFAGRYRIDPARLTDYDYGSNGMYFITICTKDRECDFGEIVLNAQGESILEPTLIGQRVLEGWAMITHYQPSAMLDVFQLMPNHLHGIVWICKPDPGNWQPNTFGPQRQNLASIVRGFKSGVKTFATTNNISFHWQPRYYERVVRNEAELNRIRQYIEANPANWHRDHDNAEGLYM